MDIAQGCIGHFKDFISSFFNKCEITKFKMVSVCVFICHFSVIEREVKKAGVCIWSTTSWNELQISAVCMYVWAEKQRDAPGLSNELSKK